MLECGGIPQPLRLTHKSAALPFEPRIGGLTHKSAALPFEPRIGGAVLREEYGNFSPHKASLLLKC